jgi:DNA mismatch repair ATPase MutS
MKALLMHRDRDFDSGGPLPWNDRVLTEDLALETLIGGMAGQDRFLHAIASRALLTATDNEVDTVLYRQAVLRDCLQNRAAVRELYELMVEAIENKRKQHLGYWSHYPSSILYSAVEMMGMQVKMLRRLRDFARLCRDSFTSEGFTSLFSTLERELDDEYLSRIETHLVELKFRHGKLMSAELGPGNVGRNYVLRKPHKDERPWLERVFTKGPAAYTFHLAPRDDAGAQILSEMEGRSINTVANALAQSADHVDRFFQALCVELAFYVGCLNLHERLTSLREPTCFPVPRSVGERRLRFHELHDVCLALEMQRSIVGNTVEAEGKNLVVVTGANQGGKSSFLRAIGVAQLMMQSGMFVGAGAFEGELVRGVATHYKREEDATMKGGKLDEELGRMSEVAEHLAPNVLVLFNESFSATNEREGSEIARQVVAALVEKQVKVFFVTHLHAFARGVFEQRAGDRLFLRAERRPDGTRTFRLIEGEPLPTSYGKDLYERIFQSGTQPRS